jgi:hypothetical protein
MKVLMEVIFSKILYRLKTTNYVTFSFKKLRIQVTELNFVSVYVDLGQGNTGPAILSMVTGSASSARSFSIKVCQIECTQINKGKNLFIKDSN